MQSECHIPADIVGSLGPLSGTNKGLLNSVLALLSGACHLSVFFGEQEAGGSTDARRAECWSKWSKGSSGQDLGTVRERKHVQCPLFTFARHAGTDLPTRPSHSGGLKVPSHCFGVVITQWPCGQYVGGISSAASIEYLQGRFLVFICSHQEGFSPSCHLSFCDKHCSPRSRYSL